MVAQVQAQLVVVYGIGSTGGQSTVNHARSRAFSLLTLPTFNRQDVLHRWFLTLHVSKAPGRVTTSWSDMMIDILMLHEEDTLI